jgi:hypothetical protein
MNTEHQKEGLSMSQRRDCGYQILISGRTSLFSGLLFSFSASRLSYSLKGPVDYFFYWLAFSDFFSTILSRPSSLSLKFAHLCLHDRACEEVRIQTGPELDGVAKGEGVKILLRHAFLSTSSQASSSTSVISGTSKWLISELRIAPSLDPKGLTLAAKA